jgi:hypothetical protein
MNAELPTSKRIVPILHWIGKQMVDEVPPEIALANSIATRPSAR